MAREASGLGPDHSRNAKGPPPRPSHGPRFELRLCGHRNLTFEILTDRGNEVAGKFGLRFALPPYLRELYATFPLDLAKFNGDSSWILPIPGRFVVDRQGIIRAAEADPDYTTRPEPSETVATLRALTAR